MQHREQSDEVTAYSRLQAVLKRACRPVLQVRFCPLAYSQVEAPPGLWVLNQDP